MRTAHGEWSRTTHLGGVCTIVAFSYRQYLHLDRLLDAQHPLSEGPEHDEMLFIIVHQVYELWFKQILHELDHLQGAFQNNDKVVAFHVLQRVRAILKTLVAQVDVLETMTPVSFNAFRSRLETASGLQSVQFREIEFLLGKRDVAVLARFEHDRQAKATLSARLSAPSLWDAFLGFLQANGITVPESVFRNTFEEPLRAAPELHPALIEIYRRRGTLMQLCERLVDIDEGFQEWRYRHVKMVERTIGSKRGTGGSTGVAYLRPTVFEPLFPDLWAIRTAL